MKPVRCQPHEIFRPRVGAKSLPQSRVLGWHAFGPIPEYKGPPWPAPRPQDAPEGVRPEEIAAWRAAHPEATCSERVARCLTWLEREFTLGTSKRA
jgi:hypothetical protein